MNNYGFKPDEGHVCVELQAYEKQYSTAVTNGNGHTGSLCRTRSSSLRRQGSTLTIHNIKYSVDIGTRCCASKKKEILKGIE